MTTEITHAERETLLTPCHCGHTINDHGSVCWICMDDGGECLLDFEHLLEERLAEIVTARVAAALTGPQPTHQPGGDESEVSA